MDDYSEAAIGSPRNRIYQVTNLEVATILAVADRTEQATSFEDLIYRESEVDALWSLCDIQVKQAQINDSPELPKWLALREKLWRAHDLIPEGEVAESAAVLRSIPEIL